MKIFVGGKELPLAEFNEAQNGWVLDTEEVYLLPLIMAGKDVTRMIRVFASVQDAPICYALGITRVSRKDEGYVTDLEDEVSDESFELLWNEAVRQMDESVW